MNKHLVTQFKALADPTRLRILGLLTEEELAVGELTAILGMAQSRVSGHLSVLKDGGLVGDRRQGTSSFYSISSHGDGFKTWEAVRAVSPGLSLAAGDAHRLETVLRRRKERAREFFDRAADSWEDGRSESLGAQAGSFAAAGLLPPGLTVLDLGTGTGSLLPFLTQHVSRVIAVDGSRGMLSRARERMSGDRLPSVRFLRADLENLPLPETSVDAVVANMVLHHLPHPESLFREIARVLTPAGRGVVIDFDSHEETWLLNEENHRWPGFDPPQLGAWCLDAGLSVPEFQKVPTPDTGRWNRLEVFAASFGRTGEGGRKTGFSLRSRR